MYKVSTPGDREMIAKELPEVMTRLEMMMPTNWSTVVMHILCFHGLEIIESAGPFVASNILDIERFHTLFKKLARGTTNVMMSIRNHHLLMEAALAARMDDDMCWTTEPLASTVAGYAARLDSSDRADRVCRGLGAPTIHALPADAYKQIQTLWADEYPEYKDLHKKFNRANTKRRKAERMADVSEWASHRELGAEQTRWQMMKPTTQVRVGWRVTYFAGCALFLPCCDSYCPLCLFLPVVFYSPLVNNVVVYEGAIRGLALSHV